MDTMMHCGMKRRQQQWETKSVVGQNNDLRKSWTQQASKRRCLDGICILGSLPSDDNFNGHVTSWNGHNPAVFTNNMNKDFPHQTSSVAMELGVCEDHSAEELPIHQVSVEVNVVEAGPVFPLQPQFPRSCVRCQAGEAGHSRHILN